MVKDRIPGSTVPCQPGYAQEQRRSRGKSVNVWQPQVAEDKKDLTLKAVGERTLRTANPEGSQPPHREYGPLQEKSNRLRGEDIYPRRQPRGEHT